MNLKKSPVFGFFLFLFLLFGCTQKEIPSVAEKSEKMNEKNTGKITDNYYKETKSPEKTNETVSRAPEKKIEKTKAIKISWEPDNGIRILDGSVPYIHRLKDKTFRIYYCGMRGILSATSSDGLNFQKEQGIRISQVGSFGNPESLVCDATLTELPDGKTRMYYKGATGPGGPRQSVHKVFSAISSDGLNFQREGVRIDSEKTDDMGWASVPEAIKLPDGRVRIYYVSESPASGHGITSVISSDGFNFIRENTKIPGFVDPAITILPDGTYLLLVARLPFTPEPSLQSLKPGIYSLVSADGIIFEKPETVIVESEALDPSIVQLDARTYRVFYGKTNEPGQIVPVTKSVTGIIN